MGKSYIFVLNLTWLSLLAIFNSKSQKRISSYTLQLPLRWCTSQECIQQGAPLTPGVPL